MYTRTQFPLTTLRDGDIGTEWHEVSLRLLKSSVSLSQAPYLLLPHDARL